MRYGVLLILLAATMALARSWWLAWPAAACAVVGIAYLTNAHGIFGKRPTGRLGWRSLLLAPFLVYTWIVWRLHIATSRESPTNECHRLVLARRLLPREVPTDVDVIVDLTSEFPELRATIGARRYINLPTLDATAPSCDALLACIAQLVDNKILVHCAGGHGRTATFAACWFIYHGATPEAAIATVLAARPLARMNREQAARVHEFAASLARSAAQ